MGVSFLKMKSQKGFTLIELISGTGILAILVLVSTVLVSWAIARFMNVKERLTAEATAYQAEVFFRNTFSQAIDIAFTPGVIPVVLPGNTGRIRHAAINLVSSPNTATFTFDQMSDTAAWTPIALFYREQSVGLSGATGNNSIGRPLRTSIYYREPTPTTSGVLFFNMGARAGLGPSYADPFIDRVSMLSISKIRHRQHDKVASIEVQLNIRYHPNLRFGRTWCPANDILAGAAGCNANVSWRDFQKTFTVPLINNLMKPSGTFANSPVTSEERSLGNLYFFRLTNSLGL